MESVGVPIFVDQDMIEKAADLRRQVRVGNDLRPVKQQVIVIERVLPLLGVDMSSEELLQPSFLAGV